MTEARPKIGISTCLLGEKVRYDGGHKHQHFLTGTLGQFVEWVPVCPEVEVGMGIPRPPVRLVDDGGSVHMVSEKTGDDWTLRMNRYASGRVRELGRMDLCGFVLKKDSPSCGMERVKVYSPKGPARRDGRGLFAEALIAAHPLLPVEEEGRLNDPKLRENFIESVFAYDRWRKLRRRPSIGKLVEFHARHKMQLLAHSEKHMRQLGKLVAAAKSMTPAQACDEYGQLFMEAMRIQSTVRKNVNVLQHIAGFFKTQLEPTEREELHQAIGDYHQGLVPLIAPLTLLRYFVRRFAVDYLAPQTYLSPHPKELMLRNHV